MVQPIAFETAEKDGIITADYRITVDFYFTDTPRRFTDELFVIDGLSENLIIGATTMQKWKIRLDFDQGRGALRQEDAPLADLNPLI